jgi:hypothetical protein
VRRTELTLRNHLADARNAQRAAHDEAERVCQRSGLFSEEYRRARHQLLYKAGALEALETLAGDLSVSLEGLPSAYHEELMD